MDLNEVSRFNNYNRYRNKFNNNRACGRNIYLHRFQFFRMYFSGISRYSNKHAAFSAGGANRFYCSVFLCRNCSDCRQLSGNRYCH
jgi:hypothetical protein